MNPIEAPDDELVRTLTIGGIDFDVMLDFVEPDEPGGYVHPDNYWVHGIKLEDVWWSAQDVLSTYMLDRMNDALSSLIAAEHREALKV